MISLRIAASFNIKNAIFGPKMLVISNQTTRWQSTQTSFASACIKKATQLNETRIKLNVAEYVLNMNFYTIIYNTLKTDDNLKTI